MIPFPGESILIEDAVNLTGGGEDSTLLEDIQHRDGGRTLTTSTTWRVWCFPGDTTYLEESGLDCTVSWVVEVAAGTVTFTAGELLDPTFFDETTPPSEALGTYTVTGPATVVIPSTFTSDQVLDEGGTVDAAFMLELIGVSGSAQVQQVKMRVWPTAGVPGGWSSPYPSWSTDPVIPFGFEAAVELLPNVVETTQEASWDSTMDQGIDYWAAATPGPHTFTSVDNTPGYLSPTAGGGLQAAHTSGDAGVTWGTSTRLKGAILVAAGLPWETLSPYGPGLVDGVDYIRPPTEVRGEAARYLVQRIGDGSTEWLNAVARARISTGDAVVSAATIAATSADTLDITSLGGGTFSADLDLVVGDALTMPGPNDYTDVDVPLPTDAPNIIVYLGHTAGLARPDWPGGANANTGVDVIFGATGSLGGFFPMLTFATLPEYRVWVPVATKVIPLRQYHRDDGLGVTPPRAYGGASRTRTGRAYGYT